MIDLKMIIQTAIVYTAHMLCAKGETVQLSWLVTLSSILKTHHRTSSSQRKLHINTLSRQQDHIPS